MQINRLSCLKHLKSTLHEGSKPPKSEANSHKRLTCVKNGGRSDTTPRKQVGFSFWYNKVLFLQIMPYVDFSALKYKLTSLEYKFQGMVMTPSCKGIGVNLVNYTNHVQRFVHVYNSKLALTHHVKWP